MMRRADAPLAQFATTTSNAAEAPWVLLRAEQLSLFGPRAGGSKPPGAGWEMIPHGRHGGFRRRHGTGYEYWYPGDVTPQAHEHGNEPAAVATGGVGTMTETDFEVHVPVETNISTAYRDKLEGLRLAGHQLRVIGVDLWGFTMMHGQPRVRFVTDLAPPSDHRGFYYVPQVQLVWWTDIYPKAPGADEENQVVNEALRRLGATPVELDAKPGGEASPERVLRLPKPLTSRAEVEAASQVFYAARAAAGIEEKRIAASQAAEVAHRQRAEEHIARIRALPRGAPITVQMSTLAWAPLRVAATFEGMDKDGQSAWVRGKMGKKKPGLHNVPVVRVGIPSEETAKAERTPQLRGLLLRADALPPDDEWFERAMQQLGLFEPQPERFT